METKYIAYYRVSTVKQGQSGFGLEAQKQAVQSYLSTIKGLLVAEHAEIETGKRSDRAELQRALEDCRRHKAKLVIAKLDRLSRNVAFISSLMDSKVEFVACDTPYATRFTLHILAAVAEHEREMIATRTKAALQVAKARGVILGNPEQALANKEQALERARKLAPMLKKYVGKSANWIAGELMVRGVQAPNGAKWSAQTVLRVKRRIVDMD
jgi:DNA invertase Pin-like site-specific DNA recombinase